MRSPAFHPVSVQRLVLSHLLGPQVVPNLRWTPPEVVVRVRFGDSRMGTPDLPETVDVSWLTYGRLPVMNACPHETTRY